MFISENFKWNKVSCSRLLIFIGSNYFSSLSCIQRTL
uniref:Uncharacterized protein n=1 Tax=Anguilla anguilla TaxID=7936 RepID=A0A0E9WDF0_ANGAN